MIKVLDYSIVPCCRWVPIKGNDWYWIRHHIKVGMHVIVEILVSVVCTASSLVVMIFLLSFCTNLQKANLEHTLFGGNFFLYCPGLT